MWVGQFLTAIFQFNFLHVSKIGCLLWPPCHVFCVRCLDVNWCGNGWGYATKAVRQGWTKCFAKFVESDNYWCKCATTFTCRLKSALDGSNHICAIRELLHCRDYTITSCNLGLMKNVLLNEQKLRNFDDSKWNRRDIVRVLISLSTVIKVGRVRASHNLKKITDKTLPAVIVTLRFGDKIALCHGCFRQSAT